ncbi:unnamed protein product [Soboliphyme baturini]|uniref:Transposase n=1 Tax=Soboliphyme baturini TaxID=241478 RepID=A0A183ISK3_9BILA|nr:unnamed protein product [Soboliphyme baturini]
MTGVYKNAIGQVLKSVPTLNRVYVGYSVRDLKNPEKINSSKPHGLLFNRTFAVSSGSITKEFCQRLIEEI